MSPSRMITRELGIIQACAIVTAIALAAMAGFRALTAFAMFASRRSDTAYVMGYLFSALVSVGVVVGFTVVLLRFAGSISAYRRSPTPGNLETVFATHNTYWKMWGIVAGVVMFLGLLIFSIALAAPHLRVPR